MKGHLKELSATHGVRARASVPLSRNSSHKSEVSRPSFATQKLRRIQGIRPSRESLDFCDKCPLGTLQPLQEPKWPLVTRLLGLGRPATLRRSLHVMPAATTSSIIPPKTSSPKRSRSPQAMAWQLFSTPSGRTRSVGRWQFSGRGSGSNGPENNAKPSSLLDSRTSPMALRLVEPLEPDLVRQGPVVADPLGLHLGLQLLVPALALAPHRVLVVDRMGRTRQLGRLVTTARPRGWCLN
jgi:hypothetical protein